MRRTALVIALGLAACTPDSEQQDFCVTGPSYRYAPDPNDYFTTFPDDVWRTADLASPTGGRLALHTDEYPGLESFPENFVDNFDAASTLDGFGLTSAIALQFDTDVTGMLDDDSVLVAVEDDGWTPWPVQVSVQDFGSTLLLTPQMPFPEGRRVMAAVFTDPDGDCIQPGNALRTSLSVGMDWMSHQRREAVYGVGRSLAEVSALTVFTTQSATTVSTTIATTIHDSEPTLAPWTCQVAGDLDVCESSLSVADYRDPNGALIDWDPTPTGSYTLPVTLWLPAERSAPVPVVVCGHGLSQSREACEDLAGFALDAGWAVIATDGAEHGDHPITTEADVSLLQPLSIFALRAIPPGIDGLRLRENFRASARDTLTLVRALELGVDVDGDGPDLDVDRMAYLGVSLGALMSMEPAALTDRFQALILFVGGGRLTQIIQDAAAFSGLVELMKPQEWTDGDLARSFPLLQTIVDGADPAVYATHLFEDRLLDDGHAPHTVLLVAEGDEVVPNSANDALAQALQLPGLGDEVWPVPGIAFAPGPFEGNDRGVSSALIQFSTVTLDGVETPADHGNIHRSDQARAVVEEILDAVETGRDPVLTAPTVQ